MPNNEVNHFDDDGRGSEYSRDRISGINIAITIIISKSKRCFLGIQMGSRIQQRMKLSHRKEKVNNNDDDVIMLPSSEWMFEMNERIARYWCIPWRVETASPIRYFSRHRSSTFVVNQVVWYSGSWHLSSLDEALANHGSMFQRARRISYSQTKPLTHAAYRTSESVSRNIAINLARSKIFKLPFPDN